MSPKRIAFCLLGLVWAVGPVAADLAMPPLSAKAEKVLVGRTPGKPVNCVNVRNLGATEIVDETAIIYKHSSKLWYVNRPDGGHCTALRPDRTLVTHLTTGDLCNLDIVHVIDANSPAGFGACGLSEFVPYTK